MNHNQLFKGSERDDIITSRRGKFIDFVAAKQREVSKNVATKQKYVNIKLTHYASNSFKHVL